LSYSDTLHMHINCGPMPTGDNKNTNTPCLDCSALKNGARPHGDPHDYLIAARSSVSSTPSTYKCLVCGTVLAKESGESGTRWT